MARLRKGVCYRFLERPYTRRSRVNRLSYIKGSPQRKIPKFVMGNLNENFKYVVRLIIKDRGYQIRQEAIESGRRTALKLLDKKVGKANYLFIIRKYPHHVLREHSLATGAGADRLSRGMKLAFGKPIGLAVQIRHGNEVLCEIHTHQAFLGTVKEALRRFNTKLPVSARIVVEEKS